MVYKNSKVVASVIVFFKVPFKPTLRALDKKTFC